VTAPGPGPAVGVDALTGSGAVTDMQGILVPVFLSRQGPPSLAGLTPASVVWTNF